MWDLFTCFINTDKYKEKRVNPLLFIKFYIFKYIGSNVH